MGRARILDNCQLVLKDFYSIGACRKCESAGGEASRRRQTSEMLSRHVSLQ
jgi:hypothetical protein